VYASNNQILYVKSHDIGRVEKYNFLSQVSEGVNTVKGYIPYRFAYEFDDDKRQNDCLGWAEAMTCGVHGLGKSILQEPNTGLAFGYRYKTNKKIGISLNKRKKELARPINERADPHEGESYAVVRKAEPKIGESPYHVAHVLFEDGNTRITIEADAGNAEDKSIVYPSFEIYSILDDEPQPNFHTYWAGTESEPDIYFGSVTVVLVPRNIPENKHARALTATTKNRSQPAKVKKSSRKYYTKPEPTRMRNKQQSESTSESSNESSSESMSESSSESMSDGDGNKQSIFQRIWRRIFGNY
jgi:hypothetical protein